MLKKSTKSTGSTNVQKYHEKNEELLPIKKSTADELEIKAKRYASCISASSKGEIIKKGVEQIDTFVEKGNDKFSIEVGDSAYQMMTLFEFDNGWLLSQGFTKGHQSLVINLSNEIQNEYDCKTTSEKTTAHVVAQSFVRMLEIQRYIKLQLDRESFTDLSTARLAVLEKSLEKASRQYQQHLILLRSMKQPPINLTVKAVTANIANQQVVQEVKHINAK